MVVKTRIADIHDMEEKMGLMELIQGGSESGKKITGQVSDKSYRIRDDRLRILWEAQA